MGSPNALQALADDSGDGQGRRRRRIRRNWVRAEVRCLSCARLIARLLGSRDGGKSGDGSSARPISFFAYRSTGQRQPVAPLTPQIRFRCADCGGTGALDDVDSFSTYDELLVSDEGDEPDGIAPLWNDARETPETEVLRRLDAETMRRLIAALPPLFREVIVLREINDLSYREIASVIGAFPLRWYSR